MITMFNSSQGEAPMTLRTDPDDQPALDTTGETSPYPFFDYMRRTDPVWHGSLNDHSQLPEELRPDDEWVLLGYNGVFQAFRDDRVFTSAGYDKTIGLVMGHTILAMGGKDHNGSGLRPHPAHDGAHLRHGPHHARDIAQGIRVRVRRPLAAPAPVARLHRQRDVEPQLAMDPAGAGQQQVFRAALTGAVHPDEPRPRAVAMPAQVDHRPGRAAQTVGLQRGGQRRIVVERQPLVGQARDPAPSC